MLGMPNGSLPQCWTFGDHLSFVGYVTLCYLYITIIMMRIVMKCYEHIHTYTVTYYCVPKYHSDAFALALGPESKPRLQARCWCHRLPL